jgi:glycosyltransferase involved in cell wall biosynthesis
VTATSEESAAAVTTDPSAATVSVVVPAHNEARVLRHTLSALAAASSGRPHVVVVANGCTDDTAEVARAAGADVVELGQASKAAALRAGDRVASVFPRIYLDADISLTPGTLDRLTERLQVGDVLAASPRIRFDVEKSSWPVRQFYRAYAELPYVRSGLLGLGVYGLSERGRRRFDEFPDVTSDDLFVQRLFSRSERGTSEGEFVVAAPRDLGNLLKVRTRTAVGNAELSTTTTDVATTGGGSSPKDGTFSRTTSATLSALLRSAVSRPSLVPSFAVYAAVTVASRITARRRQNTAWQRDVSTR